MENKLATEPTPGIFKIVKNLDQDSGPYLDWPTILRRRLSECKSVDGRYDTIGSEFDYGPDAVEVLLKTALKDEDDKTRAWAMLTLARQCEETLDPLIHDVAMQYLALDPEKGRTLSNDIYNILWCLGITPNIRDFVTAELGASPIVNPRSFGSLLAKYMSSYPQLGVQLRQLCEDHFGSGPSTWKTTNLTKGERSHQLYLLLKAVFQHHAWDNNFTTYVAALANGPMIDVALEVKDNGWVFHRTFSENLAHRHEDQAVAQPLLLQLLENERILERERGFMLNHFVGCMRLNGKTDADTRDVIAHLLVPENKVLSARADSVFSQDKAAAEKKKADQFKSKQRRERNAVVDQFVRFIAPFVLPKVRDTFLGPASAEIHDSERFDGVSLFTVICAKADRGDRRDFVITQDARDRDSVSLNIDLSREALGLSPMDDVYLDDESYSAPVVDQYAIYATYLSRKGFRLVCIYPGWDDFSAVVISAAMINPFCEFMTENLPDLEYEIVKGC